MEKTIRFLGVPLLRKIKNEEETKYLVCNLPLFRKKKKSSIHLQIEWNYHKKELITHIYPHFEKRAENTAFLISCAIKDIANDLKKNFTIKVNCEDFCQSDSETLFAYTGTGKHIIQIPDFSFLNWPECGINDYDSCCCQMIDAGQKKSNLPTIILDW